MSSIKVGWIPKFNSNFVASTRIRCLNVIEGLRKQGVSAELYDDQRNSTYRILVFLKAHAKKHVEIAKKSKAAGKLIVLDLCDNHFIKLNELEAEKKRLFYLNEMVSISDLIVVSTDALSKVVSENHPDKKIVVIGDSVEETLPKPSFFKRIVDLLPYYILRLFIRHQQKRNTTNLVWYGIHGGGNAEYGMYDLLNIFEQLNEINNKHPITLTVISNSYKKYLEVSKSFTFPTIYLPWRTSTFFEALKLHQIAVIPITLNEFTKCKSNNRIALALAKGLSVTISNPIPAYAELAAFIKKDNVYQDIIDYIENPQTALHDVEVGMKYIKKNYSVNSIASQWKKTLIALAENSRNC